MSELTVDRLRENLESLKMKNTLEILDNYLERAVADKLNIVEVLDYIFSEEAKFKRKRAYEKQVQVSDFPIKKTLDDFDFSFQPSIDKRQIVEFAAMRFLESGENVVFLGPPGVGKTHLASALGLVAAQHRFSTYYINCHQLIEQLKKASFENRPPDKLKILAKYRMLIIDEIGYLPMGIQGANLFFSSLPDAMKRPLPSSPLTKHSPSRTRSFLTSPSPPLFSTAPFTTVPLSTLRVNPAASKNARNSCDRNSRLSIPFLSKAMPDSLHLSSADILQEFLAVFLHF